MTTTTIILLHLSFALLSLAIAPFIFFRRKGTRLHKKLGRIWVVTMAITAISSFWIKEINPGHFSPIHLLSVFVLISLCLGIYYIRHRKIERHLSAMIGCFFGLSIAGLFALAPDRFISEHLSVSHFLSPAFQWTAIIIAVIVVVLAYIHFKIKRRNWVKKYVP